MVCLGDLNMEPLRKSTRKHHRTIFNIDVTTRKSFVSTIHIDNIISDFRNAKTFSRGEGFLLYTQGIEGSTSFFSVLLGNVSALES